MPSLTQTLFGSLLDSPAIVEITTQVLEKAMPIIQEHFTFTADEITKAYQNACGYSFVAISIGPDAPDSFIKKVRHSKITREFAKQIEQSYFKPFSEQRQVPKLGLVKPLQKWAKNTDKLFKIKQITEEDLSALIGHRKTLAISDLILAQMQQIEVVDDNLAAFLRFNGLLGDSVLFFFREQFRQDARVQATQTALQQERLCIDVKNIQATLDDLKNTQEKYPFLNEIPQQIQHLEQWQNQQQQLLSFQNRFADQLDEVLDWARDVYINLDEIKEDVAETKETVIKTHDLVKELKQKFDDILTAQQQNHSAQINHRDGMVQYTSENRQLLQDLLIQLQRLSPQHPLYGQLSNKAGRVLSSSGALEKAERLFVRLIEETSNEKDRALAYFNLFQVRWRKAFTASTVAAQEDLYAQALSAFNQAIALDRAYALHDMSKNKGYYPIKKMLGAGGMGCAFLCENHNFKIKGHDLVVVKCFWGNISDSLEQIFQEPKTMHDIAGDYVPEILDYGYADIIHQTKPYFVSEYIAGAIDGEAWLEKEGKLDLITGLSVAVQIANALQQAHEKGICHLDLKPANLLLIKPDRFDLKVKVIDFGLARVTTALSETTKHQSNTTVFGQAILGTLDYAPPEQRGYAYRYGQPSAKSDVFAFGMTMYRLWTGKNPHPFLERNLPNNSALRDLLCDCVAENPEERLESAQYVVECLKQVQNTLKIEKQQTSQKFIQEQAKKKQEKIAKRKAQEQLAKEQEQQARERKQQAEKKREEVAKREVQEQKYKEAQERLARPQQLSPLNPLDYFRLLWWTLVMPQNLEIYQNTFHDKENVGKWLVSTLIFLPLLMPTLALGLELIPYNSSDWGFEAYLSLTAVLLFYWLLTGLFGEVDNNFAMTVAIIVAIVVAIVVIGVVVEGVAIGIGVALIVAVGVAGGVAIEVEKSIETSTPSWIARFAFFLLVTAHLFLIYYCFFGGWRWLV